MSLFEYVSLRKAESLEAISISFNIKRLLRFARNDNIEK
jgi:hypothetical protein